MSGDASRPAPGYSMKDWNGKLATPHITTSKLYTEFPQQSQEDVYRSSPKTHRQGTTGMASAEQGPKIRETIQSQQP